MFNPFKKKENDEFELDNTSLPSLGDMKLDDPFKSTDDNFSQNSFEANNDSELTNNSLNSQVGNGSSELGDNSTGFGNSMSLNSNNDSDSGYSSPSFANNDNNGFNNNNSNNVNDNNNMNMNNNNQNNNNNMNNQNNSINNNNSYDQTSVHNDILKTKIDAIGDRVSLIDSRMQNIEQKIDMIYQLILSEVGTETKQKFQVNQSMNNRFR